MISNKRGYMLKYATVLTAIGFTSGVSFCIEGGIVHDIVVQGSKHISDQSLLSVVQSKVGTSYDESTLKSDENAIRNLGFFKDVKVVGRELSDKDREIIIQVAEYPLITTVSIEGCGAVPKEDIEKVVEKYNITGNVLSLSSLTLLKSDIQSLYSDRNYYADVDVACSDADENNAAKLDINIEEKKVGEVEIKGLTKTSEHLIRKIIKTKSGDYFNYKTFNTDWRRLNDTGWFESIVPGATQNAEDKNKVNLSLDCKEGSATSFSIMATMNSDWRPVGTVTYGTSNLLGTGQHLNISASSDAKGSGLSGSVDYSYPYFTESNDTVSMSLYSKIDPYFSTGTYGNKKWSVGEDSIAERRNGLRLGYLKNINDEWSAGVSAKGEQSYSIENDKINFNNIRQDGKYYGLTGTVVRDTTDIPSFPTEGTEFTVRAEGGMGKLTTVSGIPHIVLDGPKVDEDYNIFKVTGEFKAYFSGKINYGEMPVNTLKPVWAFRLKGGKIFGNGPFFQQFFVGGNGTLRGYPDHRFWGKNMYSASSEYRYPFHDSFYGFLFADTGYAWEGYPGTHEYKQKGSPEITLGYGFGAGLKTPLGLITLALAFDKDFNYTIHPSLGMRF